MQLAPEFVVSAMRVRPSNIGYFLRLELCRSPKPLKLLIAPVTVTTTSLRAASRSSRADRWNGDLIELLQHDPTGFVDVRVKEAVSWGQQWPRSRRFLLGFRRTTPGWPAVRLWEGRSTAPGIPSSRPESPSRNVPIRRSSFEARSPVRHIGRMAKFRQKTRSFKLAQREPVPQTPYGEIRVPPQSLVRYKRCWRGWRSCPALVDFFQRVGPIPTCRLPARVAR